MASMSQAIRLALHYGEKNLGLKDVFGQDVGPPLGGIFKVTENLETAWNTPLDERGIIGMAAGIAMTKTPCVAEIQFCDYIFNSIDLLKLIGMTSWSSLGDFHLPLVLMSPSGHGVHGSIYHSQSFESFASKISGWKIVIPSSPLEAYGLMLSAIKDPNPVLFLKEKSLLRISGREKIPGEPESEKELKKMINRPLKEDKNWKVRWPKLKEHFIPIGKAKKIQEGNDLSIITYGRSLYLTSLVKNKLPFAEIIDLRSIYPYDWKMIYESVKKTKRALLVGGDTEVSHFLEHLSYRITRELFYDLKASPCVLASKQVPGVGLHEDLENETCISEKDILTEANKLVQSEA